MVMLIQGFLPWKDLPKIGTRGNVSRFDHSSFTSLTVPHSWRKIANWLPMHCNDAANLDGKQKYFLQIGQKNIHSMCQKYFGFSEAVHWKNQEALIFWFLIRGKYFFTSTSWLFWRLSILAPGKKNYKIQWGESSPAKHGGAYFSAVVWPKILAITEKAIEKPHALHNSLEFT